MSQLLVKDLDAKLLESLKERADHHGRSLQAEVKSILETAAMKEEARRVSEQLRQRFAGRMTSDSADLIREDRDR